MLNLYKNKNFLLMLSGKFISLLGNSIHRIGIIWFVLSIYGDNSGKVLSLVLVASILPTALFGSVLGTIVDRYNKKTLIIISDLLSGVVVFLLSLFLNLSAMDWHTYEEAVKLQEKNSKIIMIDAVRTYCQYCKKISKEVFEDKEMTKWIQERFISVKLNLDFDDMPLDLEVKMTPTFYFIDKNQKIVKIIPGSWNIEDFKELTEKIKGE